METRQALGSIGSILLSVGVFMPVVSVPVVGNMTYIQNGKGDGAVILALAAASLTLTFARKYRGLWLTGLGSLAMLIFTFVNFQLRMSDLKSEMNTQFAGSPFRGIANLALQSIQLQWGWAVLVIGCALILAAAAGKAPASTARTA